MIPGAYERDAPRHREAYPTSVVLAIPPALSLESADVAASRQPTKWLGQATVVLSDVAVAVGLIFAIALAPVLLLRIVAAAVTLVGNMFGINNPQSH